MSNLFKLTSMANRITSCCVNNVEKTKDLTCSMCNSNIFFSIDQIHRITLINLYSNSISLKEFLSIVDDEIVYSFVRIVKYLSIDMFESNPELIHFVDNDHKFSNGESLLYLLHYMPYDKAYNVILDNILNINNIDHKINNKGDVPLLHYMRYGKDHIEYEKILEILIIHTTMNINILINCLDNNIDITTIIKILNIIEVSELNTKSNEMLELVKSIANYIYCYKTNYINILMIIHGVAPLIKAYKSNMIDALICNKYYDLDVIKIFIKMGYNRSTSSKNVENQLEHISPHDRSYLLDNIIFDPRIILRYGSNTN